jgi:hypothetical protein
MTDNMRERKKRYVERAMEYLDCDYFCIGDNQMERIAEICAELGIAVPDAKSIEFRYYLYGGGTTEDNRMMMRVDYKDTFYPVSDTMLDEAFFHYAQLIPEHMIESVMKREAQNRCQSLLAEVTRNKKDYQLHQF